MLQTKNGRGHTLVVAATVSLLTGTLALNSSAKAQVSYQTILNTNDLLTGVRGTTTDSSNPNVVFTGNSPSGGLLYVGNLYGGGATYTLNAFDGVNTTNTLLYGPNTSAFEPSLGSGNIQAVGTYQIPSDGSQLFGALYTGPAAGGGVWQNIQVPGSYDTLPHSVMGNLVVGNSIAPGQPNGTVGSGFIYNLASKAYTMVNLPGSLSTTLYGVWQNGIGSTSYTLVGGVTTALGLGEGLIVDYNSATGIFSNITEIKIGSGNLATHFEGVTGAPGGYNLVGMTLDANGLEVGAYYGQVTTNGDGSFNTSAGWTLIDYPGSILTTGNTVYGDSAMGLDIGVSGGVSQEQPYIATVPESSTWAMMMLGFAGLGFVSYRRSMAVSIAA